MRVKQTPNQLILQDSPGCLWLFGAFFVLVGGIFVYGSLGGFENRNEVPGYAILLAFLMGSFGVIVGIWQIYEYPLSKIILDKQTPTILFKQRGLFKKIENVYRFDEIRQFFVKEEKDGDGDSVWRVEMELKNNLTVEITKVWLRDFENSKQIVERANNFIKY